MRGDDNRQTDMFSYVSPEQRIPADHPIRAIRAMMDEVLARLSPRFDELYSVNGRPSIAPERLLRALMLQVIYTIRSERQLMEQINYNLLFRWFVGMNVDEAVWHHTVFSHNRDRLLRGGIADEFFLEVLAIAERRGLVSREHFTVDGTLVDAWASLKSFKPVDSAPEPPPDDPGNPTVNFHGEKRSNETHRSTTDPEAKLYRKSSGKEARLSFMGHVVMENRNGLAVNTRLTAATGTAERDAALDMIDELSGNYPVTVGADKAYDTRDFVAGLRQHAAVPHVAQNTTNRRSAIDKRTTRHAGYGISQRCRKKVEEIFGWLKTVGSMRKTRHRGVDRVGWMFTFATAAYNLVRMRKLASTG